MKYMIISILDPGFTPKGSLVIALVRVCVCVSLCVSVFKYLRDFSLVFSSFLHEVRAPQGYKSDRARFLKKNVGGSQMGKKPLFLGHF